MSNQAKPEHPSPWRWDLGAEYRPALAAARLSDANGDAVLSVNTDDEIEASSPVVRELIRLAPEMEALLRECAGYPVRRTREIEDRGPEGWERDKQQRISAILTALGVARAAKP